MAKSRPKLLQIDPDMDRQKFIQTFLEDYGMSARELAIELNVHHSTVAYWVNGQRNPTNATIMVMQELVRRRPVAEVV